MSKKLSSAEMVEIINAVTYKPGWTIYASVEDDGRVCGQVGVDETTEAALEAQKRDGTREPWKSGKKFISTWACRQEVVGAVFATIQDAESHEMREWFRYRGAAIYNPHLDPDVLVAIARKASSFNVRENAMTLEEVHISAQSAPAYDHRPANCRFRQMEEGKAYPKSGCDNCKTGGMNGCPYKSRSDNEE